ncbi:MAG: tetratricopeptide repeat protein [Rhizobiales bacterium]|nr:tetratricopeptide repeat protein [Hyphomicrobiales bacterium]
MLDGDHRPVTASNRLRRLAGVASAGFIVAWAPALAAQSQIPPLSGSPLGSYLAARHAGAQRDSSAAAVYYRSALRADPRNAELLERAFLAVLADGEIDMAARLAERAVNLDRNGRLARLALGVRSLKQQRYKAARPNLLRAVHGPITDLAPTLLVAWAQFGAGDWRAAVETIDRLSGPEWYGLFKDLHAGLILDLAGRRKDAGKRFQQAHKLDPTMLRVVEAYGSWASRHDKERALTIFQEFDKVLPRHPLITEALDRLQRGQAVPQIVNTAASGGAEVLYGIGASFGRRGGEDLGLLYLQLAVYLSPNHALGLLSLADLYENLKKPDQALKIYAKVPKSSPLYRNAAIQLAMNLDSLDRTNESKEQLQKLIAQRVDDREAIMALGNILRGRKQFADCAEVYAQAISSISDPQKSDWSVFYFRGICYERSKQWEKAEVDLKKALELFPDQPHVLNYLGYSWVDHGHNLDEGMAMIRKAVEQRPDDGYIVDSLGWAYYRLGNYEEAVKHLERAIEIRPEDPTINDHLGDAYWRVGRRLEASFQWAHARDLKPEPEDLAQIEKKLKDGLSEETPGARAHQAKKPDKGG